MNFSTPYYNYRDLGTPNCNQNKYDSCENYAKLKEIISFRVIWRGEKIEIVRRDNADNVLADGDGIVTNFEN